MIYSIKQSSCYHFFETCFGKFLWFSSSMSHLQSSQNHKSESVPKPDGQESVEMQIDIHLMDLVDKIDPAIVFIGLLYVANYRLPLLNNLNLDICHRLLESLLDYIKQYDDAFLVFTYFCKFPNFLQAISEVNLPFLTKKLHLQSRLEAFRPQVVYVLQQIQLLPNINPNDLLPDFNLLKESEILQITSLPPMSILPPQLLYTDKSVDRLLTMYNISQDTGLSANQYSQHLSFYGPNILPAPPKPSLFSMFISQFKDFMVLLLIVVIIIEASLQSWDAASILFAVVVLNVIIGFVQEVKANRAMLALTNQQSTKCIVFRNKIQSEINANEIVPGDIFLLNEGDLIPADGRVIVCNNIQVDESILTGESLPIAKSIEAIRNNKQRVPVNECHNNVFMMTLVAKGSATILCTRTSIYTEMGRISNAINTAKQPPSPIQVKLGRLGMVLAALAISLCALFIVIGISWGNKIEEVIKFGMVLAISAIPEGLVAVVTVTMALGVSRMANRNAIVRKLPIVETLGSLTCICTDKTGTLTVGKMGLQLLVTPSRIIQFMNTSINPADDKIEQYSMDANGSISVELLKSGKRTPLNVGEATDESVLLASFVMSCNSTSSIVQDKDTKQFVGIGDATEIPLMATSSKLKLPNNWFRDLGFNKSKEYPFDSDRKLMSTLYDNVLLVKGAPEGILSKCTHVINSSAFLDLSSLTSANDLTRLVSRSIELTSEMKLKWIENSNNMASRGLRVLGFAVRILDNVTNETELSSIESELTFVGFCGLIDPPKNGVKQSISTCHSGGIEVIMITGDHINTAMAIANELGIKGRGMRGIDVESLKDDELIKLEPFPSIFARTTPEHKLRIVRALQSKGAIVAMTGDGVNDASAIKQADVGICMGISGTEITKQAADVILANDDFNTIVVAIEEGRRVFDNILKFIIYLLSCNSAEIFLILMSAVINVTLPYTTNSTLWANIIADIPPAMSLGIEPVEFGIMNRKPRNPTSHVLQKHVIVTILVQGIMLSSITFTVYLYSLKIEGLQQSVSQTIAFSSLTTMQLVQSFLSKSTSKSVFKSGITSNKWMLFAFGLSFALMIMGIYVPVLNTFLTLVPIDGYAWLKIGICVIVQLFLSEVIKLAIRKYTKKDYTVVQSIELA
eukprot:NODE_3_length_56144_cov_0.348184.p6 type:complete len:1142 gc:universal NODE_3_length_56144_cov_0.348184:18830-15405(-)